MCESGQPVVCLACLEREWKALEGVQITGLGDASISMLNSSSYITRQYTGYTVMCVCVCV